MLFCTFFLCILFLFCKNMVRGKERPEPADNATFFRFLRLTGLVLPGLAPAGDDSHIHAEFFSQVLFDILKNGKERAHTVEGKGSGIECDDDMIRGYKA